MKFSFKKNDGDEKKAKPKAKRKSKGDGVASLKTGAANHGEKLLLGLVVLVSVYVIYIGWNREGLDSSPAEVESAINNARSKMDSPTWAEVKQVRYPEPDKFDRLASDDTRPLKAEDFAMKMPMHPVLQEARQRRTDPELLAPLELEVRPGYGAIAMRGDGEGGRSAIGNLIGDSDDTRALPDAVRERFRGQSTSGTDTEARYFISITGLVPVKAQQELYRAAFGQAIEYRIERDMPQYIALDIERRELDANGKPGEWTSLDAPRVARLAPRKWESKSEELALQDHVISSLMMPLPPIIFRDISEWAVHSKIPQAKLDQSGFVREVGGADDLTDEEAEEEFSLFDSEAASRRGEGEGQSEEIGEEFSEGAGDDSVANQLKVEMGMLRFFDFDVQPGKVYEYRARLLLEDANNPHSFEMPSVNACETAVIIRRQANPDDYLRESPWSELTTPVRVPSGRQVFAGKVVSPSTSPVSAASGLIALPKKSTDEPVARLMGVTWDPVKKYDVPNPLTVRRGSVVNQTAAEVEVIDPSISKVRKLRDYDFKTNVLVLDIAGGDTLKTKGSFSRSELRAPGMVLVMDENNNLSFRSEIADQGEFEFFEIPPDEELLREQKRRAEEEEEGDRRGGRRGDRGGRNERGGRNDRGGRNERGGENGFSEPGFGEDDDDRGNRRRR